VRIVGGWPIFAGAIITALEDWVVVQSVMTSVAMLAGSLAPLVKTRGFGMTAFRGETISANCTTTKIRPFTWKRIEDVLVTA
jgi:hypothetical protein